MEQEQAKKLFLTKESLKINAYAGTGKTSTLVLLSKADKRKGLYLAFNKSIVAEAKTQFSSKTTCKTIHSLALTSLPNRLRKKAFKSTNAAAFVDLLGLKDQVFGGKILLTAKTLAFLVIQTIKEFCQGTGDVIQVINLRKYGKLCGLNSEDLMQVELQINSIADTVWGKMINPDEHDFMLGHDGYLKLWALTNPTLNYDYILLDEAQDTNPVVLGVLQKQKCQVVYVGDAYQQIYEWRGAVNAMEKFITPNSIYLTKSFRFGKTIADAASLILSYLGSEKPMQGNSKVKSQIGECVPDAILARTNTTVMSEVITSINDDKKCHVIGGTKELLRMLRAVLDLKNDRPSDVPEFFGFSNWTEVEQLVEDGEADNLMTLVNLVRTYSEKQLMWALNRTENKEETADVIISTVFKAKGREWDRVKLANDFLPSTSNARGKISIEYSEARVFYVALTRGKRVVDVDFMKIKLFEAAENNDVGEQENLFSSKAQRVEKHKKPDLDETETPEKKTRITTKPRKSNKQQKVNATAKPNLKPKPKAKTNKQRRLKNMLNDLGF